MELIHLCRLDGKCLTGQDKTGGCEVLLDTLLQQELFCSFPTVLAFTDIELISCVLYPHPGTWYIVERAEVFVTTAVCITK